MAVVASAEVPERTDPVGVRRSSRREAEEEQHRGDFPVVVVDELDAHKAYFPVAVEEDADARAVEEVVVEAHTRSTRGTNCCSSSEERAVGTAPLIRPCTFRRVAH